MKRAVRLWLRPGNTNTVLESGRGLDSLPPLRLSDGRRLLSLQPRPCVEIAFRHAASRHPDALLELGGRALVVRKALTFVTAKTVKRFFMLGPISAKRAARFRDGASRPFRFRDLVVSLKTGPLATSGSAMSLCTCLRVGVPKIGEPVTSAVALRSTAFMACDRKSQISYAAIRQRSWRLFRIFSA